MLRVVRINVGQGGRYGAVRENDTSREGGEPLWDKRK